MKSLFLLMLRAGLWGSVIIGAVLLFRLFARKRALRFVCLLWALAAVRLVLPVGVESELSVQPRFTELAVETAAEPYVPDSHHEIAVPVASGTETALSEREASESAFDYVYAASILWACLGGLLLTYVPISYWRLRRQVREAYPMGDGSYACTGLTGAFVLGYLRPRVYIPVSVQSQDRLYIMAHEKAHIARKDNWWKLLGFVCVSLHWYNPLVWVGYCLACRDIEYACDARVIKDMDLSERKAYSMVLLHANGGTGPFRVCPVTFAESSIPKRIKQVLSYRKATFMLKLCVSLAVAVICLCFMTVRPAQASDLPEETYTPQTESTEATIPVTTETTVPETAEATVPVTTEATVPVTAETTVSVTTEATVPATAETTVPVTTEPVTPDTRPTDPTEPPASGNTTEYNFNYSAVKSALLQYGASMGFDTDGSGQYKKRHHFYTTSALNPDTQPSGVVSKSMYLVDQARGEALAFGLSDLSQAKLSVEVFYNTSLRLDYIPASETGHLYRIVIHVCLSYNEPPRPTEPVIQEQPTQPPTEPVPQEQPTVPTESVPQGEPTQAPTEETLPETTQ